MENDSSQIQYLPGQTLSQFSGQCSPLMYGTIVDHTSLHCFERFARLSLSLVEHELLDHCRQCSPRTRLMRRSTLPMGVSGKTPWPRLKMCARP